jgi:hypothetical protein
MKHRRIAPSQEAANCGRFEGLKAKNTSSTWGRGKTASTTARVVATKAKRDHENSLWRIFGFSARQA